MRNQTPTAIALVTLTLCLLTGKAARTEDWEWIYVTVEEGLPQGPIWDITIDGDTKYVCTNGGLAVGDGINPWFVFDASNSGLPADGQVNRIAFDARGDWWLGTGASIEGIGESGNGLVHYDGQTWTVYDTTNSGIASNHVWSILPASNGDLWLTFMPYGVQKFDGTTWTTFDQDDLPYKAGSFRSWSLAEDEDGIIWAGSFGGRLVKYDGTEWTEIQAPAGNFASSHLIDDDGAHWVGMCWQGLDSAAIVSLEGSDWSEYANVTGCMADAVFDQLRNPWFVSWFQTDALWRHDGDRWSAFEVPLLMMNVPGTVPSAYCLDVDRSGNVWVGTSLGIAIFREGGVDLFGETAVTEQQNDSAPAALSLLQSYPNPFNSSTVIGFDLPHTIDVDLSVFDLTGQRLVTLVSGLRGPGSYWLHWDGRDAAGRALASGVYLYALRAGKRIETHKLVVLQ